MTEPTTHTLDAPGATLTYDVRRNDASREPALLIIGSPMAAAGFVTLADHFGDRTVVTYDPRGAGRSPRTDDAAESTPDEHADDLHRLIAAVGAGPVDLFASSGGAVNALALVARHPEQVRTLVAHEPPASQLLPDRDAALAASVAIHETYERRGFGPAMARFIVLVSQVGPIPNGFAEQPDPDAMFGLPTVDDGSRNDPLLGQNMISGSNYQPDLEALRAAPTRIVIGVGTESSQMLAGRAAVAIAARLGTTPITFAGGHDGFLGGEFGRTGDPDAFAKTLRQVLEEPRVSKITASITTSLDGYITGPDDRPGRGLGEGGERLHYWVFGGPWTYEHEGRGDATGADKEFIDTSLATAGAVIAGMGTYRAAEAWGGSNPFGVPFFIVTHRPQDARPGDGFEFVGSLEEALARARQAAGEKNVNVMGGADIIRQALRGGYVEELTISVAPVVLGAGKRLFDGFATSLDLEPIRVLQSPLATHITYRVVRDQDAADHPAVASERIRQSE